MNNRMLLAFGSLAIACGKATTTRTPSVGTRHPIQRNAPCPCGSGKKFKACCLQRFKGREFAPKPAA